MRLFYLPVERYRERWTEFVSGPDGMFERQVKKLGVEIISIRPHDNVLSISNSGIVLDPVARSRWAFEQVMTLIQMITSGFVEPHDVIYCEDFWTPGMEMIPYAKSLVNRDRIQIYSFNHAQSIDPHDFTHKMRNWMRQFEWAWAQCQSGVFCAAQELADAMARGWGKTSSYIATGTVFDHKVLLEYAGLDSYNPIESERDNTVIFSSRWDKEKNPDFFCSLATAVLQERDDVEFLVLTGADELKSNDPALLDLAKNMERKYPEKFTVVTKQDKQTYYQHLDRSMVQFNCADQDFVSYTLLEAATFGCAPLYPDYLTFPDALHGHPAHLYKKNNLFDAKLKLYALLGAPQRDYSWVYSKYESSVHRMLYYMGFDVPPTSSLEELIQIGRDKVAKEVYE